MISAIVAVDNNWGIGANGDLLAHIPNDLKFFKEITMGHVVVMGRKTWDSLPTKPLPNRFNVIVTRNPEHFHNFKNENTCYMSLGLQETINLIRDPFRLNNVFIIGGGEIYKQLLPFCERVYVTKINKSFDNADTFFPNLDELEEWTLTVSGNEKIYKDLSYQFLEYDRIS